MAQSLARVVIHIVFSTKHRKTWLTDRGVRQDLYHYIGKALTTIECPPITINGFDDHIHVLCNLSRKMAIMNVILELKASSSKWIKTCDNALQDFHWQSGYGVFSVSESKVPEVRAYIDQQEEHHRRMSFQDEFRLLCERHGIDLNEAYVWD